MPSRSNHAHYGIVRVLNEIISFCHLSLGWNINVRSHQLLCHRNCDTLDSLSDEIQHKVGMYQYNIK